MSRYTRPGKTRALLVETISDASAPTETELDAGDEITVDIRSIAGFSTKVTRVDTPDLASSFVTQIGGSQKVDDSTLTFYLDSATNPLRGQLVLNSEWYIVFCDYKPTGDVEADDFVDVYHVSVVGAPKMRVVGDEPAVWEGQFAIIEVPSEDVEVQ